jgi:hypothetical protein
MDEDDSGVDDSDSDSDSDDEDSDDEDDKYQAANGTIASIVILERSSSLAARLHAKQTAGGRTTGWVKIRFSNETPIWTEREWREIRAKMEVFINTLPVVQPTPRAAWEPASIGEGLYVPVIMPGKQIPIAARVSPSVDMKTPFYGTHIAKWLAKHEIIAVHSGGVQP